MPVFEWEARWATETSISDFSIAIPTAFKLSPLSPQISRNSARRIRARSMEKGKTSKVDGKLMWAANFKVDILEMGSRNRTGDDGGEVGESEGRAVGVAVGDADGDRVGAADGGEV